MKNFTGKFLMFLTCVLVAAFALSAFVGCAPKTYTLNFVVDGASISTVTAQSGESITPPADPAKDGYVFEGWYLSADFSGGKVTLPTVMPEGDKTYYAKFSLSKAQKLVLDPTDYGTLSVKEYNVDSGTDLTEFLANIAPQAKGDAVFYGWYNGTKRLTSGTEMPQDTLTLTAKYTVAFTVQAFKQQADGTYPTSGEDITLTKSLTDGKLVGDTIDASKDTLTVYKYDEEGFEFSADTKPLTLGTDAQTNVYRIYYSRKGVRLSYDANLPSGVSASKLSGATEDKNEYLVGGTAKVAANGFTLEGYLFAGWSRTRSGQIEFLPDQTDATIQLGNKNTTLYANWNLGVTDNAGGNDLVYVLKQDSGKVLLRRTGLDDKYGTYDAETRNFVFKDGDRVVLQGRITTDGTKFNYLDEQFVNRTFAGYQWIAADGEYATIDSSLTTDGYGGAVYTYLEGGAQKQLSGDYVSQGNDLYKFDNGRSSDAFYFVLDTSTNRAYIRDELHNGIFYTVTASGSSASAGFPAVVLDGFGNAYMYTSQSNYNYGYSTNGKYKTTETQKDFDENFDFIASDGSVAYCGITMKRQDADGAYFGRIQFADDFRGTYELVVNGNKRTLVVDGFGNATYVDENLSQVTNQCTYTTITSDGTSYVYYVNNGSNARFAMRVNADGSAANVGKEAGYYLQTNVSATIGGYVLTFLDGEDVATVYVVSGSDQYVVCQANYSYNADNDSYMLTNTEFKQSLLGSVAEVSAKFAAYDNLVMRIDVDKSCFVAFDDNEGTYSYKHNGSDYTATFDGFGTVTVIRRGAESGDTTDYNFVGSYTDNGKTYKFVYIMGATAQDLVCLRLTDGETTALTADLYADYGNRIKALSGETLAVFSDDSAVVLDKNNVLTVTGNVTLKDGVYSFVADNAQTSLADYANFRFKANATEGFFYYYNAAEIIDDGGLTTDGFGAATYNGTGYAYSFEDGDDCRWISLYTNNTETYRFKIKDDKFVKQDDFCRNYYSWQWVDGKITEGANLLSLDGYGNATLYAVSMYGSFVKVADGTYEILSDNEATVTFADSDVAGFTFRKTIRFVNSTARYAYVPQNDQLVKSVTTDDGATILSDNYGEATFTQNGTTQQGYLYFVADPLFEQNTLLSVCLYTASGNGFKSGTYFYVYDGTTAKVVADSSTNIYGDYLLYEDGKVKQDLLLVDWFGKATYTSSDGSVTEGAVVATGNKDEYRFVPDDGNAQAFVFTLFTVTSGDVFSGYTYTSYFKVLKDKYVAKLVSSQWAAIQTDGYNLAIVTDAAGNVAEASFQMLSDTLLRLYFESGVYMYFNVDFDLKTFEQNTDEFIVVGNALVAYNGNGGKVTVPDGITEIGARAFFGTAVTEVNLNKATIVGEYAFAQCAKLASVDIGNVTSMGNYVFYGCYSLEQIALPTAITALPVGTFYDCLSLQTVDGLELVTEIGAYAFARCASLQSVTLTNVTTVGVYAFAQCFALADVTTGASLTSVGAYAFAVCGTNEGLRFVWNLNSTSVPQAGGYMMQTSGATGSKIVVADVNTAVELAKSAAWSTYAESVYTNAATYGEYELDGMTYSLAEGNRVLVDGEFAGFYSVTDGNVSLYLKSNSYAPKV